MLVAQLGDWVSRGGFVVQGPVWTKLRRCSLLLLVVVRKYFSFLASFGLTDFQSPFSFSFPFLQNISANMCDFLPFGVQCLSICVAKANLSVETRSSGCHLHVFRGFGERLRRGI